MGGDLIEEIVLLTGGTGSVGTALIERLLKEGYKDIRCLSNDENSIYQSKIHFGNDPKIRYILRDIRSSDIKFALEDVTMVLHAVALKDISTCRYNTFETIDVNINGTLNLVKAILNQKGVRKVVNFSTDKSCYPISIYGATKFIAEEIFNYANYFKKRGKDNTLFCNIRFGNILNSRFSVLEVWRDMPFIPVAKGMKRFFMTSDRAIDLIFKAIEQTKGGELFILKMPVIDIYNMAEIVAKRLGKEIKEYIPSLAERKYEFALNAEESLYRKETEDMFIISREFEYNQSPLIYSTQTASELSKEEIEKLLKEINYL